MTKGLREEIDRANRLLADRPMMIVTKNDNTSGSNERRKFDLRELNKGR